jgi:hypothetical protein
MIQSRFTPEQRILWNYASALIAYTTITPLVYTGAVAGSEFLTYNAGKLYIALELHCQYSGCSAAAAAGCQCDLYNMANALMFCSANGVQAWDTTAAVFKYITNNSVIKNVWFARVVVSIYNVMKFIGYRLNV